MPQKIVRETDLYPPVKSYLESLGYTVRGEVKDCDVVAVKGDDIVVVELKRNFSSSVLIQATERQRLTDSVYIALPRPRGRGMKGKWRGIRRLLRRLELGLIFVGNSKSVPDLAVAMHPEPYERKKQSQGRRALLEEFNHRSGDYTPGGSTRRPLVTAYRERAIHIACCLRSNGTMTPKQLRAVGTGDETTKILYQNVYGWFTRERRGHYSLTSKGVSGLEQFREVAARYENG